VIKDGSPVALVVLAMLTAWTAAPAPPAVPTVAGEEVIPLEQAPPAVGAAAVALAGGAGNINSVVREGDAGHRTFEVEFTRDARSGSAVYSPAGELMELEQALEEGKLPEAVKTALARRYPGTHLGEIQLVTRTFYEVELKTDEGLREVSIDPAGGFEQAPGAMAHERSDAEDHEDGDGEREDGDRDGEEEEDG
jgi:hypothetical protein